MALTCSNLCKKLNFKRSHAIFFFYWQTSLIIGTQLIYSIFLGYKPEWSCQSNVDNLFLSFMFYRLCKGNVTFRAPFYSAAEEFRLLCAEAYHSALITTLLMVGVLLGAFSFGQISDTFGRKKVSIFLFVSLMIVGSSTATTQGWIGLAVCRFFVGIFTGGMMNVNFTYTIEMIGTEQRILLRSFINWGGGRLIATLIIYAFPTWRIPAIILSVGPAIIGLITLFFVPESIKWLQTKKRFTELEKSQKWISKLNKEPIEHLADNVVQEAGKEDDTGIKQTYTFVNLFSNKTIAVETLTMMLMWFTASISSYANDLNSRNLSGDFWLNQFLFSLLIWLSKPLLFLLDSFAPRFNRRLLHQIPQGLIVVGFLTIILLIHFEVSPTAVIVINLIGCFLIEYTWDACYVCAAEGFPTVVRSIAIGSCSMTARFGGILAPQLAYLAELWSPSPFLAVVIVGSITFIVSVLFLPDTKGKELEGSISIQPSQHNTEMENQQEEAKHML